MKRLKWLMVSLIAVAGMAFVFLPTTVLAVDCTKTPTATGCPCAPLPDGTPNPAAICADIDKPEKITNIFQDIVNILLYIAGIIAIIVIIVSGIKFASSHGDSSAVNKARQNLIYAVAGLVIAVMAFAIVNFVFNRVGTGGGGGGSGSGGSSSGTPCSVVVIGQDPNTCKCPPGTTASGNPLKCQ